MPEVPSPDPHDLRARVARLENLTRAYGPADELQRQVADLEDRVRTLEMALKVVGEAVSNP